VRRNVLASRAQCGQSVRVVDQVGEFERFDFSPEFDIVLDPEFPGDGVWRCDVHRYGPDGQVRAEFHSATETPVIIEVNPIGGQPWVGQFTFGGLGGTTGLYAMPNPSHLCAVVNGLAYVINVRDPGSGAVIVRDLVEQVVAVEGESLLLFVGDRDILTVGREAEVWRAGFPVDSLRVVSTASGKIECTVHNLGASYPITLDTKSGHEIAGPGWASYDRWARTRRVVAAIRDWLSRGRTH